MLSGHEGSISCFCVICAASKWLLLSLWITIELIIKKKPGEKQYTGGHVICACVMLIMGSLCKSGDVIMPVFLRQSTFPIYNTTIIRQVIRKHTILQCYVHSECRWRWIGHISSLILLRVSRNADIHQKELLLVKRTVTPLRILVVTPLVFLSYISKTYIIFIVTE